MSKLPLPSLEYTDAYFDHCIAFARAVAAAHDRVVAAYPPEGSRSLDQQRRVNVAAAWVRETAHEVTRARAQYDIVWHDHMGLVRCTGSVMRAIHEAIEAHEDARSEGRQQEVHDLGLRIELLSEKLDDDR